MLLKRAALSRPSGEWDDDDFDVLASGAVVHLQGQRRAGRITVDVGVSLRASRGSDANARLGAGVRRVVNRRVGYAPDARRMNMQLITGLE